jgi:hypothetical protein
MALLTAEAFAISITVEDYQHPDQPEFRPMFQMYLDGAKDGLITYDLALMSKNKQSLFCIPDNLALTVEQTEDIVLRWAKKHKEPAANLDITIALLFAFQETFPCNR